METPDNKDDHYRLGLFYYNSDDTRIFVPKKYGIGWTVNFANMWSYVFLIVVIGAAAYSVWAAKQKS